MVDTEVKDAQQGDPSLRLVISDMDGYGRFMMVQDVMDCDGHITYPTKHDQWFADILWLSNAAVKMKPTCRCWKCVETTSGSEKGLVEEFKGPLCKPFLVMLPMFGTPPTDHGPFPWSETAGLTGLTCAGAKVPFPARRGNVR